METGNVSEVLYTSFLRPRVVLEVKDGRMVGGEIALSAANPEPYVKVSLHTAPQCMVIVIDTCHWHL